jgi:hypothetical protein
MAILIEMPLLYMLTNCLTCNRGWNVLSDACVMWDVGLPAKQHVPKIISSLRGPAERAF